MSDADESDIGEAAEALEESLPLKAGVAQLDPRGEDSRYAVKTLKPLARKARAAPSCISRNNWRRRMMRFCTYIISC
jgi:hypothetical protein